jgi:hypothetical protein
MLIDAGPNVKLRPRPTGSRSQRAATAPPNSHVVDQVSEQARTDRFAQGPDNRTVQRDITVRTSHVNFARENRRRLIAGPTTRRYRVAISLGTN